MVASILKYTLNAPQEHTVNTVYLNHYVISKLVKFTTRIYQKF